MLNDGFAALDPGLGPLQGGLIGGAAGSQGRGTGFDVTVLQEKASDLCGPSFSDQ